MISSFYYSSIKIMWPLALLCLLLCSYECTTMCHVRLMKHPVSWRHWNAFCTCCFTASVASWVSLYASYISLSSDSVGSRLTDRRNGCLLFHLEPFLHTVFKYSWLYFPILKPPPMSNLNPRFFFFFFLYFFTTYSPNGIFPMRNPDCLPPPPPRKASRNRVALPTLACILDVLVFP